MSRIKNLYKSIKRQQTNLKMCKRYEYILHKQTKKTIQIDKLLKKYSKALVTGKLETIKQPQRYHYISTRKSNIRRTDHTKCW